MQSYAARKGARRESATLNQLVRGSAPGEMPSPRFAILEHFRR